MLQRLARTENVLGFSTKKSLQCSSDPGMDGSSIEEVGVQVKSPWTKKKKGSEEVRNVCRLLFQELSLTDRVVTRAEQKDFGFFLFFFFFFTRRYTNEASGL